MVKKEIKTEGPGKANGIPLAKGGKNHNQRIYNEHADDIRTIGSYGELPGHQFKCLNRQKIQGERGECLPPVNDQPDRRGVKKKNHMESAREGRRVSY